MTEATHVLETGTHLVDAARRAGADEAEVYLRYGPGTRVTWQHNCMSQSHGWESNLALRLWRNGRSMIVTTSDFTAAWLTQLAQHTCEQLAQAGIPDQPLLPRSIEPLVFPATPGTPLTMDEQLAAVQTLLATVGANWPLATTILNVSYAEELPWIGLVNSHGFTAVYQAPSYALWAWLEGENGHLVAATSNRHFAHLNLTALGHYLHERAILKQQPSLPTPNGRFQVLLSPAAAADLARTLGILLTGENAIHALPLLLKRLNTSIATKAVTLIDDSTLPNGAKSRPIDDEGTATEATTLIEKGVLKTLLHTRHTAEHLSVPPNGKAMRSNLWQPPHSTPSNIYLQAGHIDPELLQKHVENGLIVTSVLEPGRLQGTAGNFVMVVQGHWVENKQTVGHVNQARLSLNIFELLRRIRACGNDLQFSPLTPGAGGPSLLIEGMQVG